MKNLLTLICLGIVGVAVAQDAGRLSRIWEAADTRMVRQVDAWFKGGDFPRLIQLLKFRVELYPNDYEAATDLGWMLENVDEKEQALAVYRRYRERNPKDPDAPYPEANYYFVRREYEKIPPLLEPSLSLKPHPNSYRILAHSYERMDRLKESKRVWEAYLALFPDDGAAKRNLERVIQKIGS